MLILTEKGLFCPAGDFYIDPCRGVDHAVITHSHADHARRGSKLYHTVDCGVSLLRQRLGQKINVAGYAYGQRFTLGNVTVSFHPAGHILGSAQVRLEYNGQVWVVSGDYKRDPDPTCHPFEPVPCDVFVTEATFGTPAYRWPKNLDVGQEIMKWWQSNAEQGKNSVLFAYSLGKAQRVLGVLATLAAKPIYCHPTVTPLNECYRAQGISLAPTICLSTVEPNQILRGELFLVPGAFLETEKARILGDSFETAFASGWMSQTSPGFMRGFDRGFILSDHADWDDLVKTILETGARRVYVQHRGRGALVRHLRSLGILAFPEEQLIPENPDQLALF